MSPQIVPDHFKRAAAEIGHGGENDTLPYDIDAQFIKEKAAELSEICFELFQTIDTKLSTYQFHPDAQSGGRG